MERVDHKQYPQDGLIRQLKQRQEFTPSCPLIFLVDAEMPVSCLDLFFTEPLFIRDSDVGDVASCSFDELAVNLLRFLLYFETQFPSAALSHKELLCFIVGAVSSHAASNRIKHLFISSSKMQNRQLLIEYTKQCAWISKILWIAM